MLRPPERPGLLLLRIAGERWNGGARHGRAVTRLVGGSRRRSPLQLTPASAR
jgi:hypothetical protein